MPAVVSFIAHLKGRQRTKVE